MACVHLQKLYALCQEHELRFHVASSDLVRIVCRECGSQDVCPSNLTESDDETAASQDAAPGVDGSCPGSAPTPSTAK
jgi:hypothetical protein